jgi:hypothetical protein
MSNTTARDLPQVAATVDPAVRQPLTRVIEETQRLLGFRGDPLDAAITERRAREIGLTDGEGRALTGNVTYNNTFPTLGDGAPDTEPDLTPPPTPTGFGGTAGFSFVNLEWDNPGYTQGHGHGQTNVYGVQRSPPGSGTLPVFGDAQIVHVEYGTSPLTSIPSELNTRWHLWIKWQSVDGVESVAAAGGINGLVLDTAQDVTQLLDVLTDQITASELDQSLLTPINTSYLAAGTVTTHFWGFDGSLLGWVADGVAPTSTLTSGATAATLTATGVDPVIRSPLLGSVLGSDGYLIRARIRRTSVTSGGWEGNCFYTTTGHAESGSYVKTVPSPADLSVWNVVEWDMSALSVGGTDWMTGTILSFRLDFASAGDSTWEIDWISVERPATAPLSGAILVETQTRSTETGGLLLQWSVKTDINGYIAGFGFASTLNNATPSSQFIIRADRFVVAPPINFSQESEPTTSTVGHLWRRTSTGEIRTWDGDSWEPFTANVPFVVQATATTEGGVAIPAGTYIDAAYIKGLTAVYARIQTLVADDITAADISATQITGGTMQVGSFIQSTNYTSGGGGAGWRINADGTAFLQAAYIRGQLVASQIDARGLDILNAAGAVVLSAGADLSSQVSLPGAGLFTYRVASRGNGATTYPIEAGLYNGNTGAGVVGAGFMYRVVTITRATGAVTDRGAFNTLGVAGQDAAMAAVLNGLGSDMIVVVFTFDEPQGNRLTSGLAEAMYRHGASPAVFGSSQFAYRSAYVLVGIGGCGVGNGFEAYAGTGVAPWVGDPNSWCDVSFTVQNGLLNISGTSRTPTALVDYGYVGDLNANFGATNAQLTSLSDTTTASLATKLNKGAADVLTAPITLSTSGAIQAGNTTNGSIMSPLGLVGYKDGSVTFWLNAANGDLVLGNSVSAATGYFNGVVAASGTFSGTLTAGAVNAVNTINIAGEAVSISRAAFAPGTSASLVITVPAGKGGALAIVIASISAPRSGYGQYLELNSSPGGYTLLRNESVGAPSIPALNATVVLGAGTHTFTVSSDDGLAFNAFVAVLYAMK